MKTVPEGVPAEARARIEKIARELNDAIEPIAQRYQVAYALSAFIFLNDEQTQGVAVMQTNMDEGPAVTMMKKSIAATEAVTPPKGLHN